MTEIHERYEYLQRVVDDHANDEANPFADYWMALMVILTDEELIRLCERCSMEPMSESVLGYCLGEALNSEIIRRNLVKQVKKLPHPKLHEP